MAVNTKTLNVEAGQAQAVFKTTLYDGVPDSEYQYASGMTVVGMRYVPKFADPLKWDINNTYEALEIVMWKGNSYTSRQAVPTGIDIMNEDYWVCTGNYNAQTASLQSDVEAMNEIMKRLELAVKTLIEQNENEYKVYENTEEMTQDEYLEPGMTAKTLGYHKMDDGGASVYVIGESTANGYDIIQCENGTASLVMMTPELLPEQVGAYGNASTDDTKYLERAFNMRVPLCMKKYYLISSDLKAYEKFYGGGEIRSDNDNNITMANSCPSISDITFYGTNLIIETGRSENKSITDCVFDNYLTGIKSYNVTTNTIEILRCKFLDQKEKDISTASTNHEIGAITFQDMVSHGYIRIENCQFINTTAAGIALIDTYADYEMTVSYNDLQGIGTNAANGQSANQLDSCIGIYIPSNANDMQRGMIGYNQIRDVVGTAIYARIHNIIGNNIHNCGYVQNISPATPTGIMCAAEHVAQNIIDCCAYHAVELITGIWRCDIVDNTILGAPYRTRNTNYQQGALANINGYIYTTNTGGLTSPIETVDLGNEQIIEDGSVAWYKVGTETEVGIYSEDNRYTYCHGNTIANIYAAYNTLPIQDSAYELEPYGYDGVADDSTDVLCIANRAGHLKDSTALIYENYEIDATSRFGTVSDGKMTPKSNTLLSKDFTSQYKWVLVEFDVGSGSISFSNPESAYTDDNGRKYGIVLGGSSVELTNATYSTMTKLSIHVG